MGMRKRRKVKLRKAYKTIYRIRGAPHAKVLYAAYTRRTAMYMRDVFERMYNGDGEDSLRFI